jgi:4a-hydroxytetrahydrobiopterin dehydratase
MPNDTKLNEEQIQEGLKGLSGWALRGDEIVKIYTLKNFKEALAFVNQLGEKAEAVDHHPDILINYKKVTLTLSTHSAGGLTPKDFALAGQIDSLGFGA